MLVEPNANQGRLQPFQEPGKPWQNPADPMLGVKGTAATGFTPNGIPTHITADSVSRCARTRATPPTTTSGHRSPTARAPTPAGGKAKVAGVNGSSAKLPFGLDPATTPVLGSYAESNRVPAFVVDVLVRAARAVRRLAARS